MLERIDSYELCEWAAMYLIEPFGQEWGRTAKLAATMAWLAGNEEVTEESFLPVVFKPVPTTVEELMAEEEVQSPEDFQRELMKLGGLFKPRPLTEDDDGG